MTFLSLRSLNSDRQQTLKDAFNSASLMCVLIISALHLGCQADLETGSVLTSKESELLDWIKGRALLVREHKADCAQMALALRSGQSRSQPKLKHWRQENTETTLMRKLRRDPQLQREITLLIQSTNELYSECAYQHSFITELKR